MRGDASQQAIMLSALTPDQLVPGDHPIRRIKPIVERALGELAPVFREMYAHTGRPSIPPEHLLKSSLLIALYSGIGQSNGPEPGPADGLRGHVGLATTMESNRVRCGARVSSTASNAGSGPARALTCTVRDGVELTLTASQPRLPTQFTGEERRDVRRPESPSLGRPSTPTAC